MPLEGFLTAADVGGVEALGDLDAAVPQQHRYVLDRDPFLQKLASEGVPEAVRVAVCDAGELEESH